MTTLLGPSFMLQRISSKLFKQNDRLRLTHLNMLPYFLPSSINSRCEYSDKNGRYPKIGTPVGPGGTFLVSRAIKNLKINDSTSINFQLFNTNEMKSVSKSISFAVTTNKKFKYSCIPTITK